MRIESALPGRFFSPVQKSNSRHAETILDFHLPLYYPYLILY